MIARFHKALARWLILALIALPAATHSWAQSPGG